MKALILLLLLSQSLDDVFKSAVSDMDAERWPEAIAKFEQVLKEDSTHIPTMFNLAVSNYNAGNTERAVELYKRIISQDSKIYEARVNLGILLLELADPDGAAEQLEASVQLSPDDPKAHFKAATAYYSGREYDRAYPHLVFAEKNGTPSAELYLVLSDVEEQIGLKASSIEHLQKAADLAPDATDVQRRLAVSYFNEKEYAKAIPALERVIRLDPKQSDSWEMISQSYFQMKRYPEAADASLKLLTLKPDSPDGYWTLGFSFYELKDWARASRAFVRYLQLKPTQPVAEFVLATCFDQLNDAATALLHYNKFLEIDDQSSDVRTFQARERAKALDRRLKRAIVNAMKYASSLFLMVVLSGCVLHPTSLFPQQTDKQLIRLAQEREKLKRQTNPVDRTKTEIKISEILITLVSDAIQRGDFELMEDRLDQYTETIQDAHTTMMKTGRDAHDKPGGFKDLEISLRRQVRQLEDLGGSLSYDQRDPLTRARTQASDIRDSLLKALLGGKNATSSSA